jgi:hypothetical protein
VRPARFLGAACRRASLPLYSTLCFLCCTSQHDRGAAVRRGGLELTQGGLVRSRFPGGKVGEADCRCTDHRLVAAALSLAARHWKCSTGGSLQLGTFATGGYSGGRGALYRQFPEQKSDFLGSEFGPRDPSSCVGLVSLCIVVLVSGPALDSRPVSCHSDFCQSRKPTFGASEASTMAARTYPKQAMCCKPSEKQTQTRTHAQSRAMKVSVTVVANC